MLEISKIEDDIEDRDEIKILCDNKLLFRYLKY